jgi:hypothetical protein
MARSPEFKVYDSSGVYQSACKEPEQAACLVSFLGDGATIRHGHSIARTVWVEGKDGRACDSYDLTSEKICNRILSFYESNQEFSETRWFPNA